MKTVQHGVVTNIEATANLDKERFIGFSGAYCGAGAKALGTSYIEADSGEMAAVVVTGIAIITTGGAITAGGPVASDANGKAIAATTFSVAVPVGAVDVVSSAAQPTLTLAGGVLPQAVNGYALDTASGADEKIRIRLV